MAGVRQIAPARVVAATVQHTGGNAFLVHELIASPSPPASSPDCGGPTRRGRSTGRRATPARRGWPARAAGSRRRSPRAAQRLRPQRREIVPASRSRALELQRAHPVDAAEQLGSLTEDVDRLAAPAATNRPGRARRAAAGAGPGSLIVFSASMNWVIEPDSPAAASTCARSVRIWDGDSHLQPAAQVADRGTRRPAPRREPRRDAPH